MTEMIPWEDVRAELIASGKVTEESLAQAKVELDAYIAGYRLAELRHKTGMTQVQVAEAMGVSQARISAMERGDVDSLTIASVRGYVTALGGTVRIVASLDDTDVTLRLPRDSQTTSASGDTHASRDPHHSAA